MLSTEGMWRRPTPIYQLLRHFAAHVANKLRSLTSPGWHLTFNSNLSRLYWPECRGSVCPLRRPVIPTFWPSSEYMSRDVKPAQMGYYEVRRHHNLVSGLLERYPNWRLYGLLEIHCSVIEVLTGDTERALRFAQRALAHADESGHFHTRIAAHINLSHIEERRGNFAKAKTHIDAVLSAVDHNCHLRTSGCRQLGESPHHLGRLRALPYGARRSRRTSCEREECAATLGRNHGGLFEGETCTS